LQSKKQDILGYELFTFLYFCRRTGGAKKEFETFKMLTAEDEEDCAGGGEQRGEAGA
jgi:hypothetical protein